MNLLEVTPETEFPITVTKEEYDEYSLSNCKRIHEKLFDLGNYRIAESAKIVFVYKDELKNEYTLGELTKKQHEKLRELTADYMKQISDLYFNKVTL